MKKTVVTILLGVMAFVVAGCTGNESEKKNVSNTETTVTSAPVAETTTTTVPEVSDIDAELDALCLDSLIPIQNGLIAITEGAAALPYTSNDVARDFLATSREFIEESISMMENCAEHDSDYNTVLYSLYPVQDAIDEYEAIL